MRRPTISCAGLYELARHILFHHSQGYAHSSIIINILQMVEMTRNKLRCNGMNTAIEWFNGSVTSILGIVNSEILARVLFS